jgi:hypothetical protein
MVKPPLRTKSIGFKVSEDEYAQLETAAKADRGFSGARVRKRRFSLKRSTIVFIELGMLAGIVLTGYTLPGSTPLRVFLIASGACFVAGNILLARKIKQIRAGKSHKKGTVAAHFSSSGDIGDFLAVEFPTF